MNTLNDPQTEQQPNTPRILARQLARPLTDDEIEIVVGGLMRGCDTDSITGCPANDCDS